MEHNNSFGLVVSLFNYKSLVASLFYFVNDDAVLEFQLFSTLLIMEKSIYLCHFGFFIDFDVWFKQCLLEYAS